LRNRENHNPLPATYSAGLDKDMWTDPNMNYLIADSSVSTCNIRFKGHLVEKLVLDKLSLAGLVLLTEFGQ
jgi:hypothetical protein